MGRHPKETLCADGRIAFSNVPGLHVRLDAVLLDPEHLLHDIRKDQIVVVVQGENAALNDTRRDVVEKVLQGFLLDLSRRRVENVDLPLAHHEGVDGPRVLARHVHAEGQVLELLRQPLSDPLHELRGIDERLALLDVPHGERYVIGHLPEILLASIYKNLYNYFHQ